MKLLVDNARSLIASGYYDTSTPTEIAENFFTPALEKDFCLLGEIKPGSPSQGRIVEQEYIESLVEQICPVVDGISILTEPNYFFGHLQNLQLAAQYHKPQLMKDIIIAKKQIEASGSSSAILLIYRILTNQQIAELVEYAHKLKKEVILEVDCMEDFVQCLNSSAEIIAVNNRNLQDFSVDVTRASHFISEYEPDRHVLAFSGYTTANQIREVRDAGASGVLVGTALSQHPHPGEFIEEVRRELQ